MESSKEKQKNILVLDLELNQPSEKITELGYVIGDIERCEILIRKSFVVNPVEMLSPEIIELTGIKQDDVDNGCDLRSAYLEMVRDLTKHDALPLIHQWGTPDAYLLRKQINDDRIWKFGRRWIDTKALAQSYAIINGTKFHGGLKKVARRFGVTVSNKETHRADYDAEITLKLHTRLTSYFLHEAASTNRTGA